MNTKLQHMKNMKLNILLSITCCAALQQASGQTATADCDRSPLIYIGDTLEVTNGGPDGVPPLVIMGEYNPAGPLATSPIRFPSEGSVLEVDFYGGDYDFTLYALTYKGPGTNANEQTFEVDAAQTFAGTVTNEGVQRLELTDFHVKAGDFLAFAGIGPFYPQNPNDGTNSDATYEDSSQPVGYDNDTATPPGGPGTIFSVGVNRDPGATYDYIADNFGNQGRYYAIGVIFRPEEHHRRHHGHFPGHGPEGGEGKGKGH